MPDYKVNIWSLTVGEQTARKGERIVLEHDDARPHLRRRHILEIPGEPERDDAPPVEDAQPDEVE